MPIALALAAPAWVLLLVAAPVMSAAPAAIVYAIGSLICHQRPDRSFHLAGAQLPVCARCFGIYVGTAIGAITAVAIRARSRESWSVIATGTNARAAILLVSLPTLVTILAEAAGIWDPHNIGRAIAGVVFGAGVVMVVLTLHYDECVPRRPIAPHRPPTLT